MEYLRRYEDFLIKNASQITSIESSLRSLTYILPGRFHDAELASQAVYAALNLVGLYHNSILRRAAKHHVEQNSDAAAAVEQSSFNKYISFWSNTSKVYKHASTFLSVVSYTQVLLEMGVAKRSGRRAQLRFVALLESLKVILRIIMFRLTRHRMGMHPTHLERDVDPSMLEPRPDSKPAHTGKRTGVGIPRLAAATQTKDVSDYLLAKVLTPEKLRKPVQMVQAMSAIGRVGEILFILRPLVYVLAILRFGQRSWRPWLLSLVVELAAQTATQQEFQSGGSASRMTQLEKKEASRRTRLLWLNLLRGAAYTRITRPRLERVVQSLEHKPLVSMAANVLRDYLPLWESVYFYTSGS